MGSRYIVVTLIMAVVLYIAGVTSQDSPTTKAEITQLPALSFTLTDGTPASLSDLKGRLVLIHFWASWCPPCLPELPELVQLAKDHPELTILAYSLDHSHEKMQAFYDIKFGTLPENFIALWDENGRIAKEQFYSFTYPETYIIGCDGNLAEKVIGAAKDWEREIEPHLMQCVP